MTKRKSLKHLRSGPVEDFPELIAELAEVGDPAIVSPDELRALGVDPDDYFKTRATATGLISGWMLDRKKDAALIERLQSMRERHQAMQ